MDDIRYYYKHICFIAGAAWIGGAICTVFDSIITSVFAIIFALAAVIVVAIQYYWTRHPWSDTFDEMAEMNILKAKAHGFDFLLIAMCLLLIVISIQRTFDLDIGIKGQTVVLLVLGLGELATGFRFLSLEKNGDRE